MKISYLFFCLFVYGVFGDTGEVKTVSVMEGESLTLHTDTVIQTADRILWIFGPENDRIAQINRAVHKISIYEDVLDGKFRQRLKLDYQTGNLTINDIRTTDSGLFKLQIYSGNDVLSRRFSIIVSGPLPVPDITSDCPQNSSSSGSTCVLLCSVMNVTHVTLSWYKGNSLFSSISASDLNIRLSLPLEVEYQDTNTYSCVLNNPIRNQTQHLNITELCQPCSIKWSGVNEELDLPSDRTIVPGVFVGGLLVLAVAAMGIYCIYRKFRKTDQDGQTSGEEHTKLNVDSEMTVTDIVKIIKGKAGNSIKLDTGVKDIQACDLIQWKFGEAGDNTNPCVPIVRMNRKETEFLQDVNGILGNRLKLNKRSGSITIKHTKTSDSGLYKLEINNSTNQVCKSFLVTVSDD